jgi:DNA-binding NarL/FixJ family response regulator
MRIFHAHHPNMLVSDLALSQGDGISLLKAIRGQAPGIAAIALTGISDSTVRRQALNAGFDRYLVKPVDIDVLAKAVSALTSKAGKLSA